MRPTLAAVAVAVTIAAAPVHAQNVTNRAALVARLDSIVQNAMQAKTAGIQVAVIKGRDTLLMKGYGLADAEDNIPVTPQTVFKIGSVTKQFTSAAVMRLVQEGKATLDDTVGKLLPKAPVHWHRVTLRQLLNHTSGIPSFTDIGPRAGPPLVMGMRRDSIFELLRGDSLMFEPGKGFYYNNTGYFLLGMVVEQLSGKSYATYLNEMIAPLGLTQTTYCGGREIIPHRADGYDRQGQVLVNTTLANMETPFSAGAMCSTARDLVRWGQALATGRVVSAESFKAMTTPIKFATSFPMNYGFALTVDSLGSHRVVQHGGNINGFSSHLLTIPADSVYVAVNINVSGAPAPAIASDIARAILNEPRKPVAAGDEPVSAGERAMMAGRYSIGMPDGTRRVFVIGEQGESLTMTPERAAALPLQRLSKTVFAVRGQPNQRVHFEVVDGKATAILIDRGARPLIGRRVP